MVIINFIVLMKIFLNIIIIKFNIHNILTTTKCNIYYRIININVNL